MILGAVIVLVFVAAGCYPPEPPVPPQTSGLTEEALKNAEYESGCIEGAAPMINGEHYYSPPGDPMPGEEDIEYFTVIEEGLIAFGDLDGDGVDDAAVILGSWTGGSGYYIGISAVSLQGGVPVNIASECLGDRVLVNSIAIENNEIVLSVVTHGPDDALCCPTMEGEKRFKLDVDMLIEQ